MTVVTLWLVAHSADWKAQRGGRGRGGRRLADGFAQRMDAEASDRELPTTTSTGL